MGVQVFPKQIIIRDGAKPLGNLADMGSNCTWCEWKSDLPFATGRYPEDVSWTRS